MEVNQKRKLYEKKNEEWQGKKQINRKKKGETEEVYIC